MKLDETNCTNLKQLEITLVGISNKKLLLILKMYLICWELLYASRVDGKQTKI